ncbi:P63C domain-containing protein [Deinococcus ficus]|nr:P63C domain-containing protein [Deinococcus ficus]
MDEEFTLQRQGGIARAKKLSSEERSEISRKAADTRWAKAEAEGKILPRATHSGELQIGGLSIKCAVLQDGTRVITETAFMKALGVYYSGWLSTRREESDSGEKVPNYISHKALIPYISDHLNPEDYDSVWYRSEKGTKSRGIRAEIIPKICEIWMDARNAGVLTGETAKAIAARAEIMLRALARVGITALVDEATGYQEIRDRQALQALLDQYLRKEFATWAKRFPDEFYHEIYRLRGWTLQDFHKRPGIVGKYTTDIVYERMAPELVEELEKKNPSLSPGYRRQKHHQWLTEDVGHPALSKHIDNVIVLMRASDNWDMFKRLLDRSLPKRTAANTFIMPGLFDDIEY